jgi:CheY-like chemotaxis protein
MAKTPSLRVAVVDDDLWVRAGRASTLAAEEFDVVVECDHEEALSERIAWEEIDVVLLDAWDAERQWDRFPGVAVVEAIRRSPGGGRILIIVISGHATNELLRLRMAEAGADFFYAHSELRTAEELADAIRRPDAARRSLVSDSEVLSELGISPSSRLNAGLHDIESRGLQPAFAPRTSQKALPVGRRTLITTRARLADIVRMTKPGTDETERQPEWRRVVRLINRARGAADGSEVP